MCSPIYPSRQQPPGDPILPPRQLSHTLPTSPLLRQTLRRALRTYYERSERIRTLFCRNLVTSTIIWKMLPLIGLGIKPVWALLRECNTFWKIIFLNSCYGPVKLLYELTFLLEHRFTTNKSL